MWKRIFNRFSDNAPQNELAQLLERYGIIVKLFADDVKVYLEVVNVDDANKLHL